MISDFFQGRENFLAGDFGEPFEAVAAEKFTIFRFGCGDDSAERSFVRGANAQFQMRETEVIGSGGNFAGRIFVNIAAQDGEDGFVVQGFGVPGKSGSGSEERPAYGQGLRMTAIAPIGIEIADGAGFFAGPGGGTEIGKGVVVFADQCLPGRGAGTVLHRRGFWPWQIAWLRGRKRWLASRIPSLER